MLGATIKAAAKLEDTLKEIAEHQYEDYDPEKAGSQVAEAYRAFFEEAGLRGVNKLRNKIETYY